MRTLFQDCVDFEASGLRKVRTLKAFMSVGIERKNWTQIAELEGVKDPRKGPGYYSKSSLQPCAEGDICLNNTERTYMCQVTCENTDRTYVSGYTHGSQLHTVSAQTLKHSLSHHRCF